MDYLDLLQWPAMLCGDFTTMPGRSSGCSFAPPRLTSEGSIRMTEVELVRGLVLKTLAAAMLAAVLAVPLSSTAQFPGKPLRVVVPFPAGSSTDTVTRILANSVSQSVGQPLIVENKAGAD